MQQELVNSNHTSNSKASPLSPAEADALERLSAFGPYVLYSGDDLRRLTEEQIELRRLRALADERCLRADDPDSASTEPPRLWTVKQMAKAMHLSEGRIRRLARDWPSAICVAHCCGCRGGTRGCELRFLAEATSAWLSGRRKRAER